MSTEPTMTRAERIDLLKIIRMRARVARSGIATREAELLAQLEGELAAVYPENDPRWRDITAAAERAVAEADDRVGELCREAGIDESLRPRLFTSWIGRGESGCAKRRAELRKVGQSRIAAAGKAARLEIERAEAELSTTVLADGLGSDAAVAALESLPTAEALMAPLSLAELEADTSARARATRRWGSE